MIKNYTSTVPIEKTIMRIELALINGGAVGITKEYDNGDLKAICFSVPSKEKQLMSIRLPADVNAVFEILKGRMKREPSPATLKNLQDQAGRTAWKIVQEWVEIHWCKTQFRPKRESPLKPAEHCSGPCRSAHWRERNKRGAAVFSQRIKDIEDRLSAIESTLKIK